MSQPTPPGLYIVATPIGNLGDLTARARNLLETADLVVVEDSRVTGKLLNHIGKKVRMQVYNDHKGAAERAAIIGQAQSKIVALVSDAGTPLISDPGYRLVREARAAGVAITSLPGPSAVITALTLSGLPTDRFLFEGFLPSKDKARRDALKRIETLDATLVFYENPSRVAAMLTAASAILGAREAAVVREISKKFEEVITGPLAELAIQISERTIKGEIVVVIGPPGDAPASSLAQGQAALADALRTLSPAKAASQVAKQFGLDRKALYALAIQQKNSD